MAPRVVQARAVARMMPDDEEPSEDLNEGEHRGPRQEPRISAEQAAGHTFAEELQQICQGQPVPHDAVAVMRSSDGRNAQAKKAQCLAFLVPERGRYIWMRNWEAWGLRKCSLCGML